ncbi:MAG: ROK family protein [Candidatus Omnitrophica bacterium]|nr:ROK family protein [Candidatus Omnitrophota bacterium]MDD5518502.1 ROK family protein [Candidatus Omnitrophota bacterium]
MREIDLQKEALSEKERRNIEILDILRKRGPISRPDISRDMGINVVTISSCIDEFIKHNLVFEKSLDVSEGGRRPVLLDLNSKAGFVIGVGLNLMNMVGLLVDFKGNIITKTQVSRPKASVSEISESILEIVREILRRSKECASSIHGIGVGIAGLINKNDGSIHWPQKTGHYYTYATVDVPLKDLLEKEFNLPTLMENDATSACFGEYWLGLGDNYKNILYMFSGVGCGIMINGDLYRGAQGYAGEVAIYNYKEQDNFNCQSGNDCFLKRWDIDLGIVEDVRASLLRDTEKGEEFSRITQTAVENIDLKTVFTAARAQNVLALRALESAARRLGVKIAYLVNLLNPQIVVIGGGLEEAGDEFLRKVSSTVKEWAFRESAESLKVAYSQLRENTVALGAASLVMQRVFAQL